MMNGRWFALLLALFTWSCSESVTGQTTQPTRTEIKQDQAVIAAPLRVILLVKGLSCPQCAGNVERQLSRIKAIDKLSLDLDDGLITLTLRKDTSVTRQRLGKAIDDAGYTLEKVFVEDGRVL